MPAVTDWGDVATWVTAVTSAGALGVAFAAKRTANANDTRIQEMADAQKSMATTLAAIEEANRPGSPKWRVTVGGTAGTKVLVQLKNVGTAEARGVEIPGAGRDRRHAVWPVGEQRTVYLRLAGNAIPSHLRIEAVGREPLNIQLPAPGARPVEADG